MNTWRGRVLQPQKTEELAVYLDMFLHSELPSGKGVLDSIITGLDVWAQKITNELGSNLGLPFLKTWWRPSQLLSVLRYEFQDDGCLGPLEFQQTLKDRSWMPVGTVLHWPAANVPIQPFLSLTNGLLSGNRNIVRVPSGLVEFVNAMLNIAPPELEPVLDRVFFVAFPKERIDLAGLCAERSDAAMIWGGQDAVAAVRNLPFPHWARLEVFGPRISAIMVLLDEATLRQTTELERMCRRIAREVWQFDQQACSSPLVVYLQVTEGAAILSGGDQMVAQQKFVHTLAQAFEEEELAHPRDDIDVRTSVNIAIARSRWLLEDPEAKAIFPFGPAWSILYGGSSEHAPELMNGKVLHIVLSQDLEALTLQLDRQTQTIGVWIHDSSLEMRIARSAMARGVDRVVRLGLMHVFNTPWDGRELVRPLCRKVHYISTQVMERNSDA
jgi:hypothetical protein